MDQQPWLRLGGPPYRTHFWGARACLSPERASGTGAEPKRRSSGAACGWRGWFERREVRESELSRAEGREMARDGTDARRRARRRAKAHEGARWRVKARSKEREGGRRRSKPRGAPERRSSSARAMRKRGGGRAARELRSVGAHSAPKRCTDDARGALRDRAHEGRSWRWRQGRQRWSSGRGVLLRGGAPGSLVTTLALEHLSRGRSCRAHGIAHVGSPEPMGWPPPTRSLRPMESPPPM